VNTTSPLELSGRHATVIDGVGASPAADAVRAAGGEATIVSGADAARLILSGDAPVVVFSDTGQAAAVFDAAAMDGRRTEIRRHLAAGMVIALGEGTGDSLRHLEVAPALEGSNDLVSAEPGHGPAVGKYDDTPFMRACRGQDVPYTPLWLMRQAGRYMEEYRRIRAQCSMLELCRSAQRVSEVTVHAAETLNVDAAIIFADLLLIVEPLGLKLEYLQGEGPAITPAVRDGAAVDALREVQDGDLSYVWDAVRQTRADLAQRIPLIGFAGAPFTVASYLVEGGASRNFLHTKGLMYGDEGAWNALMEKVVRGSVNYLCGQVEAGAQVLQLFDSWVGCLSPADYRRYVLPHTASLLSQMPAGVPVIHFGTGTGDLLPDMRKAGGSVIGADWRVDLDVAWERIGHDIPVMGNLDPLTLFGPREVLEREVRRILGQADNRNGHIFNLGHGILPGTPVDNVRFLVDLVHEVSAR
jgi:uroporphyrinogen decarboxylase